MSHTYTNLLTHVIFSTKDREPFITAAFRDDLLAYLGGIMRELGGKRAAIDKRRFAQGVAMLKALSNCQLDDAAAAAWLKRLVVQEKFRIRRGGLWRRRRWFRRIKMAV